MKTILAISLVALTSMNALADDEATHSIALSGMAGGGKFDHRGAALEAQVSVGGAYSLRALLAVGTSTDHDARLVTDPMTDRTLPINTAGEFETLRVGFEARSSGAPVRVFGGVDIGYEADHRTFAQMSEYIGAFATVPRIGFEVGDRIRARAAFEMPLLEHFDGDGPTATRAASIGVSYAF